MPWTISFWVMGFAFASSDIIFLSFYLSQDLSCSTNLYLCCILRILWRLTVEDLSLRIMNSVHLALHFLSLVELVKFLIDLLLCLLDYVVPLDISFLLCSLDNVQSALTGFALNGLLHFLYPILDLPHRHLIRVVLLQIISWLSQLFIYSYLFHQHFSSARHAPITAIDCYNLINIMSLLQFLQQTLIKEVSHKLVQQIQEQHTAVQSLLDTLSELHLLNKARIIAATISSIQEYISFKENILLALSGLNQQWYDKWVAIAFNRSPFISELLNMQRPMIENMVVSSIRRIFVAKTEVNDNEENWVAHELLSKLNYLLQCQNNKTRPTRQSIQEVTALQIKFAYYLKNLDEKVHRFNQEVGLNIQRIKQFEESIKKQFEVLLNEETVSDPSQESESPFKELQRGKQFKQSVGFNRYSFQTQDHFQSPGQESLSRCLLPPFGVYYNDTT